MGGFYPTSTKDRIFFSIFLGGGHLYLWYERCLVLPYYYPSTDWRIPAHTLVAGWIYFQIISNIFLMRFSNFGGDLEQRHRAKTETWRWCEKCKDYFPPRSHHCKLCDECILRRDHHCWFSGCCVGASNHKYFIVALTYICLAAVYGNIVNFKYVCDSMGGGEGEGGLSMGTLLCILLPHFAMATGQLTFFQLFVALMTLIAYLTMVLTAWLLQIQFVQTRDGQTKYERKKKIKRYDRGLWNNINDCFGPRWYLIWIWPWVASTPADDGMSYMQDSDKSA